MSDFFKGVTFPWQEVTAVDDAIARRAALPDRRLSGCELSYAGYMLTMGVGSMLICGRQFRHTKTQSWSLTGATAGYARLLLTIDVTKASTEDAFEQISASVEYATAADGFAVLRQDDINSSGTAYQAAVCIVALSSAGITGIVDQMILGQLTAQDVGARPDTWTPTAEEIGAALSGYGLGEGGAYPSDVGLTGPNLARGGFFRWDSLGQSNGYPFVYGTMLVVPRAKDSSSFMLAYCHADSYKGTIAIKQYAAGTETEWEYLNPPMVLNDEYRTAERWRSKAVYTKLLNFGTMPNATTKSVSHGLSGTPGLQIIRCVGQNITLGQTIPSHYMGNGSYIYADTNAVHIHSTVDSTAHTAYAQIWYVKN